MKLKISNALAFVKMGWILIFADQAKKKLWNTQNFNVEFIVLHYKLNYVYIQKYKCVPNIIYEFYS